MPGKNKDTKSSSISRNLHWVTRPSASIRDLALWGADVLGAPSHITNAVRDVSNRVANLPIIGLDAAYNYATGNNSTWEDAFKEADTNPSALASAFEVFPITNTESNYSDAQLANQYELRKHSPGKPGQITHDGYRYINQGRYAGDIGTVNFFSPSKVNEWSIGQTSGIADEEGNTYTSDLFAYDTKDTNNAYLKAIKEGKASPAMFLRGALGVVGAKGYDDGTNSATAIRTKIDTKAQKRAYDGQNKKAEGGSLRSSWNDLSLAEKSEMMKVAIKNGITDLSTIRQKYNEFAEGGDVGQKESNKSISEKEYRKIMRQIAKENYRAWGDESEDATYLRILKDPAYDYRGYYNKYPDSKANASTHWTDEFKTVYHPTFSDESKYSGVVHPQYNPSGQIGGHWVGQGDYAIFMPAPWTPRKYPGGGVLGGVSSLLPAMPFATIDWSGVRDKTDETKLKVSSDLMRQIRMNQSRFNKKDSKGVDIHSTPQDTYLLDRGTQRRIFLKRGFIEAPKDYGLVKTAVGDEDIPVYQQNPDAINRKDLTVIGNLSSTWLGNEQTALEHPGGYPTAIYAGNDGKFYQKAWDLNDYGNTRAAGSTKYKGIYQTLANVLDMVGSPTVVTTGYQPIEIEGDFSHIYTDSGESLTRREFINSLMKNKGLFPYELNDNIMYGIPEVTIKASRKKSLGGPLVEAALLPPLSGKM